MAARVITITNQKGGVAKTTTAHNLSSGLAKDGHKVLMIDLDPQCNLTSSNRIEKASSTIYEVIDKTADIRMIRYAITENLHMVAGSEKLSVVDVNFATVLGKEHRISEALDLIKDEYDFIIIDTAPSLGLTTLMGLGASDEVVIVAQADQYSLDALYQIEKTVDSVRKYIKPTLKIDGILITRYTSRNILSNDMKDNIENKAIELGTKIYPMQIREAVAIKESQALNQSIFDYAPKSRVASDYRKFVEAIERGE